MGSKYTSQSASGYNSSPPPDDGTQVAGNLVSWATQKTKLADPIKNLADGMNTALVEALDYSPRQITTSDTVVAGDNGATVEISPSATTGVVVTLTSATTLTNNYRVWIKNSSPHQQTITRAASSDTIENALNNLPIPSKAAFCLRTNNAADGFFIEGVYPLDINSLTEDTAPAVSDTLPTYDLSATTIKKVQLDKLFKVINGLTEDTSPASADDFVATYDASASAAKKVKLDAINGVTLGTEAPTTSGTTVDIGSIPTGVRELVACFVGVSTSGTSPMIIQIGDSGGVEDTGYVATAGTRSVDTGSTAGFIVTNANVAATSYHGRVVLTLEDSSDNTWCASGTITSAANTLHFSAGSKSLSGTLDRIRLTTAGGTDTFDAGTVNIAYKK